MEINQESFTKIKERAESLYLAKKEIHCPYFQKKIILNSDGFHHLQFSSRRERNKNEQFLKFRLLPLALGIVEKSRKIKTILRRVGDGNIVFWSVMPYSKIKNGEQRMFSEGIEED